MKIGVLGAGAWGTALALLSARGGNSVTLWSYDGAIAEFDGVQVPQDLKVTKNMADLMHADAWIVVTPAAFFRETIRRAAEFYAGQPIIVCTKGIEPGTNKFMSEIIDAEIPDCTSYGVLSGPQFAGEVALGIPTGSTLAGGGIIQKIGQTVFGDLYLEHSDDIIGTEICGVGKNAVALISGYISVTARGENERAMIFTRAWNDVMRFGIGAGARPETFLGLCGLGDLFLTATSMTSRNYSAGLAIANNEPVVGTVEGINALNGLVARAGDLDIELPVLSEMQGKLKI